MSDRDITRAQDENSRLSPEGERVLLLTHKKGLIEVSDTDLGAVVGGDWPWEYAAYGTCYLAGVAGSAWGGEADWDDPSDYCHDRYLGS